MEPYTPARSWIRSSIAAPPTNVLRWRDRDRAARPPLEPRPTPAPLEGLTFRRGPSRMRAAWRYGESPGSARSDAARDRDAPRRAGAARRRRAAHERGAADHHPQPDERRGSVIDEAVGDIAPDEYRRAFFQSIFRSVEPGDAAAVDDAQQLLMEIVIVLGEGFSRLELLDAHFVVNHGQVGRRYDRRAEASRRVRHPMGTARVVRDHEHGSLRRVRIDRAHSSPRLSVSCNKI